MERVIVIVGPTCSGKTKLSLSIAQKLNTEIISADSRQIYRYLTIGTAKPSVKELSNIKHHFIDRCEPNENFNVYQFEREALEVIKSLHSQGKIPIVVGGSGLYIKSLIDGIFQVPDANEELKNELNYIKTNKGINGLYEMLKDIDPISANSMLPQNWKRVMRAIEVYKITGRFIWQLQGEYERDIKLNFYQFGLNWNRAELYGNINSRVDEMIESGLLEEVESLLSKGFSQELNSMNTVGYKELIHYLEDKDSLENAINLIKRNTRRFAKRQLTWFRKDKRILWFDVDSKTSFDKLAEEIIKIINVD